MGAQPIAIMRHSLTGIPARITSINVLELSLFRMVIEEKRLLEIGESELMNREYRTGGVEQRLELFQRQVDEAQWKRDHDRAMQCWEFQDTLKFGSSIFDSIVQWDLQQRLRFAKEKTALPPVEFLEAVDTLLKWWLRPCDAVEGVLKTFEAEFGDVEGAEEFRKRHEEAKWMLAPASEAFDHPKMVDLRDDAIDALRREDVLTD